LIVSLTKHTTNLNINSIDVHEKVVFERFFLINGRKFAVTETNIITSAKIKNESPAVPEHSADGPPHSGSKASYPRGGGNKSGS